MTRYNYYTHEDSGMMMLRFPRSIRNRMIVLDLLCRGEKVVDSISIKADERVLVPFPLDSLRFGMNEMSCCFSLPGERKDTVIVEVMKWSLKSNEVKIDYATGGLIVEGLPFFPFGFYCYSPVQPTLAEEEVVKGFNMMSPYQNIKKKTRKERRRYMDRCAELGMKVHYQLLSVAGGGGVNVRGMTEKSSEEKRKLLEAEIIAFRDHPALLAWYISDEPVGHGVAAEDLVETYRLIKNLDPYHPVSIVFMAPHRAKEYRHTMDVVMADPYPIPGGSVMEVERISWNLKSTFGSAKPLWIVPQAFGGNEFWQREPTPQEIRVMTYLAIIHGATGIQYFIRHGLSRFPKSTVAWSECGMMAREIGELTPFLLSDDSAPGVSSSIKSVKVGAWKRNEQIVILAVNTENRPRRVTFRIRGFSYSMDGNVLFENRILRVRNGIWEDEIEAFGTRAYMITREALSAENEFIDPDNLLLNSSFEENPSVGTPAGCYARLYGDRGATYFIDSRIALHGEHSLRLVTPRRGEGVTLAFFPFQFKKGNACCYSIWGRTTQQEPKPPQLDYGDFFRKLFPWVRRDDDSMTFRMQLGLLNSEEFELTPEWKQYFITASEPDSGRNTGRVSPILSLTGQGKAWFDCMQVVIDPVIETEVLESLQGMMVTLSTKRNETELHYTRDGAGPSTHSPLYTEPFLVDTTCVIKAGVFEEGELQGVSRRSVYVHSAFGKKVGYQTTYASRFTGGGAFALVDGITGTSSYWDGRWQGFLQDDMNVTIDLGGVISIRNITAHFLQNMAVWIFLPTSIEFAVSMDGEKFTTVYRMPNNGAGRRNGEFIQEITQSLEGVHARYIRVRAKNIGVCPPWHRGAGGKAWIFVDEILVN